MRIVLACIFAAVSAFAQDSPPVSPPSSSAGSSPDASQDSKQDSKQDSQAEAPADSADSADSGKLFGAPSAGVEIGYFSRYTWRGMEFSTGPSVQPYGWFTEGPLTVSLWGNDNVGRKDPDGGLNGGDAMALWSQDFGKWRIEPGYEYWFDRPVRGRYDPPTAEASANVSWGSESARIFVLQVVDVMTFKGAYYGEGGVTFTPKWKGLEWEFDLRQAWVSPRFNRLYSGVDGWSPTYFGGEASATRHLPHGLYVRVHAVATGMEKSAIRRSLDQLPAVAAADIACGFEWPGK
jgi:hypothetical protein